MKQEMGVGTAFAVFLGTMVAVAALVIGSMLLGGVILKDLWTWFIVPLGVPAIGLAHAIGINMTAGFLAKNPIVATKSDVDKTASKWGTVFTVLLVYLMTWGIGAIVHSYM